MRCGANRGTAYRHPRNRRGRNCHASQSLRGSLDVGELSGEVHGFVLICARVRWQHEVRQTEIHLVVVVPVRYSGRLIGGTRWLHVVVVVPGRLTY